MNDKKYKPLFLATAAGVLGLCLRLIFYRIGFDDRNILSSSHPLHIACLVLAAIMAIYLLLAVRKTSISKDPLLNFPEHPLRTAGSLAAAGLMACYSTVLMQEAGSALDILRTALFPGAALTQVSGSILAVVRVFLTLAAALAMAIHPLISHRSGIPELCRHGVISVFFALDMLCRYQSWSGNPQLPDYVLQVFAGVSLALTGYQRLAFSTGLGKRRTMLFCSLMSLFLCLVCVAGPDTPIFYLGSAFWSGSCMCAFELPAAERESQPDA